MNKLKTAVIILLIVLIAIISFVGIYKQDKNIVVNLVKDYNLGMDLKGGRVITVEVEKHTNTIYYDKNGKVVEKETKGGKKEEVPINKEEVLTKENYQKTRKIIERRLSTAGIDEYLIRQDENNGKITVQIPEDNHTNLALQYISTVGKFTIEGDNNEVLLDNSNIKSAKVGYNTLQTGTNVYLNIELNKDSIDKLKEISKTYVKTIDEQGKDIEKKVTIKLDDNELISTSFDEEVVNGVISISVGNISTNTSEINGYVNEANNLAILLNSGEFPVIYELGQNRYIKSDITIETLAVLVIIILTITIVAIVALGVIYKKNGVLAGIANIGYIALLLLVIRYANVIITIEGITGIIVSIILNYVISIYLLREIQTETDDMRKRYNKALIRMLLVLIPVFIVGITLCFTIWMPMYSFGEVAFWGGLIMFVYNVTLTRSLLINQ